MRNPPGHCFRCSSKCFIISVLVAQRRLTLYPSDPDSGLSTELYQTWSSDSRVFNSDILPGLIPLLFDDERLRNPSVKALLREWAPIVVPKLVERRRLNILVDILR